MRIEKKALNGEIQKWDIFSHSGKDFGGICPCKRLSLPWHGLCVNNDCKTPATMYRHNIREVESYLHYLVNELEVENATGTIGVSLNGDLIENPEVHNPDIVDRFSFEIKEGIVSIELYL